MHFEPSQCRGCRGPLQGWRAESLRGRGVQCLCPREVPQDPVVYLFIPFSIYPMATCFLVSGLLHFCHPFSRFRCVRKGKAFDNAQQQEPSQEQEAEASSPVSWTKMMNLIGHSFSPGHPGLKHRLRNACWHEQHDV